MHPVKLILFVCLFLLSFALKAQGSFIENKGQWPERVEYKMDGSLHQVYFEKDGFKFNLVAAEDMYGSSVHHKGHSHKERNLDFVKAHAYKMKFVDANPDPEITPKGESKAYTNYFLGKDPSKWASGVKSYHEIYYKELYTSVDLRVYEEARGFKYDFIVKPGGAIDEIQMHYEGVDKFTLSNGDLKIHTSVGKIIESKPYVYQMIKGKLVERKAEYLLENQVLSYRMIDEIDERYELIIDPSLIFSTYSGATSDNWGFTATGDLLGNVYQGGVVFNTGYPTTLGAYQIDFAGGDPTNTSHLGTDISISKFSPDGTTLLWASLIGGESSEEMPHSLVVNQANELIIFGTTGSNDYPTTPTAYDNSFNGGSNVTYDGSIKFSWGSDIIISKISADGSELLASTYIGGSANDGLNYRNEYGSSLMTGNGALYYNYADGVRGEVIVDLNSDIFIGTSTFSDDFPMINGFQPSFSGLQEGVVFKLSANLDQLIWSTYIGGSQDDAIYSLEINTDGETYVSGGTRSTDFPTSTDAYETEYLGGTTDGFVTHISAAGDEMLASTFFGSTAYDQAYFVRRDKDNNVYISGQTEASGTTLINNAAYNTPNSGQFIAKFLPGLSELEWSTTFGTGSGVPNISISAFSVDFCNRIYLSGWGREWGGYPGGPSWDTDFGTHGMEVTEDAEQPETDGQDFYIMVLSDDASTLNYATFFGEQHYGTGWCGNDHVDGGTSRFDRMGNIYQSVCASCGVVGGESCNAFPTTTGAFSEDNGGIANDLWVCNNAVFRFSFAEDITVADFFAEPFVCENELVQFTNAGVGQTYNWNFGDGFASSEENPSHLYSGPGLYEVTLITADPASCNLTDTIVKEITIVDQVTQTIDSESICLGAQVQIGIENEIGVSYVWSPSAGLSNVNISNPNASPITTTNYTLIAESVCKDTLYQTVEVINVDYNIEAIQDTFICEGGSVELSVSSDTPINQVIWSNNIEFTSIINTGGETNITVSPTDNKTYYVKTFEALCNVERIDSAVVEIDIPNIIFSGSPYVCQGGSREISVSLSNGEFSSIYWEPESIILSGQGSAMLTINPTINQWLSVSIENTRSCTASDSIYLEMDNMSASYQKTDLLCHDICTGSIALNYAGIDPFEFYWDSGSTNDSESDLCAGIYNITVTDAIGCMDSMQVELTQPPAINVLLDSLHPTGCGDLWNTGEAFASAAGGVGDLSYLWSNGDTNPFADSLYVNIYHLTVTDENNCEAVIAVQINDTSDLDIDLIKTLIQCHGDCNGTVKVKIITGSYEPYTFNWSLEPSAGNVDSIGGLCEGSYGVTVSDVNECKRLNSVQFFNPDSVDLDLEIDPIICHEYLGKVTGIGSGGVGNYYYKWSDGQTGETAHDLSDGNYGVTVFDSNDCPFFTNFTIQSPDPLLIDTILSPTVCETACKGTAALEVSGGLAPYHFIWEDGSELDHIQGLCMGNHTVILKDSNTCVKVIAFYIDVDPNGVPLEATAQPTVIFSGQSAQLSSTEIEGYSYLWYPDQNLDNDRIANPIAYPVVNTDYIVQVTDSLACTNIDTVRITVKDVICDEPYIYVPNAFSPNDDGENDKLYVRGEMIEELNFSVYNRWGELVFNTTQLNQGWDGVYKGEKVDPAVFVYHLKATCLNKKVFEKQGNITLIK